VRDKEGIKLCVTKRHQAGGWACVTKRHQVVRDKEASSCA